jgi:hypothetical protein
LHVYTWVIEKKMLHPFSNGDSIVRVVVLTTTILKE